MVAEKKYDVAVSSQTQYIPEQSDEEHSRFVFAYTITIRNNGSIPAQLVSRHWIITDGRNQVQEVLHLAVPAHVVHQVVGIPFAAYESHHPSLKDQS